MRTRNDENHRMLYFQIGLTIALAIALFVINYETPKTVYENNQTEISGLEMQKVGVTDSNSVILPPEIKK
ncbi:MAG: hypothetical protein IKQ46_09515 [Bacteroidales bacterium]|nr:hypothetical protein [Bacteroidales bacterium]